MAAPALKLVAIFRAAGKRFSEDGCAFLAQAIAFNALFAIFPIVLLGFAVLAFVYGDAEGQARAVALISTVAPGVEGILTENVRLMVNVRGLSGLIALVALIWSGKNLFMALAYALDRALGVPKSRPLINDILVSLVMLPILGAVLVAATAVPIIITFVVRYGGFSHAALMTQVAGYGAGVLLIFLVTMLLYTYLPNRHVALSFGVPGAIFTTFAWELAQIAFAIYSIHINFRQVYGALAALAILLLWFYYMGTIFLFGAQLSAQWLEHRSDRRPGAADLKIQRSA